jgi:hypothetical protein
MRPMRAALLVCFGLLVCTPARSADEQPPSVESFLKAYEKHWSYRHSRLVVMPPSRQECLAALPALRTALERGDAELKARTASVLGWMYPLSDGMADALVARLKDADPHVRATAAGALAQFVPDAAVLVGPLKDALLDPDAAVREAAALSLGRLGPSCGEALAAIEKQAANDPNPLARAAAVSAVAWIDPHAAVRRFLADMESPVAEARIAAAWAVRWLRLDDAHARSFVLALTQAVADTEADHRVRAVAFDTIDRCFRDRPEAVEALPAALAAERVEGHGPWMHMPWDDDDRPWKADHTTDTAYRAVAALAQWPLSDEQIVELVTPGIMGEHRLRTQLIRVLARRAAPNEALTQRLVEIVKSTQERHEPEAALAALLKSDLSREKLAELAAPHAERGSTEAIEVLGQCGPAAKDHAPVLFGLLRDKQRPWLMGHAAKALTRIGEVPPDVLQNFAAIVANPQRRGYEAKARLAAAEAMAAAGQQGIAKLIELTGEQHEPWVRDAAVCGLGAGGADALVAVPMLIELAAGPAPIRDAAQAALVRLGPVALPLLVEELNADDPGRVRAVVAYFRIPEGRQWLQTLIDLWLQEVRAPRRSDDSLRVLGQVLAAHGANTAPTLLDLVENGTDDERAWALGVIHEVDASVLAQHITKLESLARRFPQRAAIRQILVTACLHDAPENAASRDKLLALMRDESLGIRSAACTVCRCQHVDRRRAAAALADAARLETPSALHYLQDFGPDARGALPALVAIARDPERYKRNAYYLDVLKPIVAIGPGEAGTQLLRDLLASGSALELGYVLRAIEQADRRNSVPLAPDLLAALRRELGKTQPDEVQVGRLVSVLVYLDPVSDSTRRLIESLAADPREELAAIGRSQLQRDAERTIAYLSHQITSRVYGPIGLHRELPRVLDELASRKDPRCLPALRIVAVLGPDEQYRRLALELIEDLNASLLPESR